MAKFKPGDHAFILESNRIVCEVTVVRCNAGMYLFRFQNGGGIQLKEHRVVETEEDAKASIPYKPEPKRSRTPYDYM